MEKEKELIVRCKNSKCFYNKNKLLHCGDCKEGKLIIKCWNCDKEHEIECTFRRIDCECGVSMIPCEINTYRFENEESNN